MAAKRSACLRLRQVQGSKRSRFTDRGFVPAAIFVLLVCVLFVSQGLARDRDGDQSAQRLQVAQAGQGGSAGTKDFDHLQTGFPLTGAHARADCETCHVRGVFEGTPNQCRTCHAPGRGITVTLKPANHIPTNAECDQCHRSNVWMVVRFDHSTLGISGTPQLCTSCHNGFMAEGKPSNHIVTNAPCDVCHSIRGWLPATFSHNLVAPGSCASCHNGVAATGKPANHIPTAAPCDACHRTNAWVPAFFDHANVAPGTCATCHNGVAATGKPANHIPTSQSCDACHSTRAWVPTL